MIKFDNNLLTEIGMTDLTDAEKNRILKRMYGELEMRVGRRISLQMTADQNEEFNLIHEAGDDAGAFEWLERNVPNYQDITRQEFFQLRVEAEHDPSKFVEKSQVSE